MPLRAGHRRRVITRLPGAGADASLPGPAPPVRCWCAPCPSWCPRRGPGGMRDRARHLTTARRRPRWRPATGGRKDAIPRVARLRHARATGCGHGTGGRHLRCHGHGRVGPSPLAPAARCAGPAAARSRSCGDGPSGLDQSGAVSCPTVPLPVRAPSALGSLGYQGARDLTGRPGRRQSCRRGLAGVAR